MGWVEYLKECGKCILFWDVPRYERGGMYVQAITVLLCYTCWSIFPLAPGDTIAGLAVVAVIMTVRADHFTRVEQVVWVIIGFALFLGEISVIHKDKYQHDAQQLAEEQKQATEFSETLKSFQDLHEQNQVQLRGMTSILRRTREAEGLAKDTLENITGGDSYIYFQPQTVMGPIPTTVQGRSDQVMLMLVYVSPNFIGKHPLHNVLVEVADWTGIRDYDYGTMLPFSRVIKAPPIQFEPDKSKQFAAVFVTTANGNYSQSFLFVKIKEKWTWSTRFFKGVGKTKKLIREWSAPDFPKNYRDPDWANQ